LGRTKRSKTGKKKNKKGKVSGFRMNTKGKEMDLENGKEKGKKRGGEAARQAN
jgi:hypothetical protein